MKVRLKLICVSQKNKHFLFNNLLFIVCYACCGKLCNTFLAIHLISNSKNNRFNITYLLHPLASPVQLGNLTCIIHVNVGRRQNITKNFQWATWLSFYTLYPVSGFCSRYSYITEEKQYTSSTYTIRASDITQYFGFRHSARLHSHRNRRNKPF